MTDIDFLSLALSAIVILVGSATAYVTWLNLRAVTEVSIYLFPETRQCEIVESNAFALPSRMQLALLKNTGSFPPRSSITVRWFDFFLGNGGPGVAKILRWCVNYDLSAADLNSNYHDDSGEMKCNSPLVLGPQARVNIVGYVPRDYAFSRGKVFNPFSKIPTSSGTFPWILEVHYVRTLLKWKKKGYVIKFEVNERGEVKQIGPFVEEVTEN